EGLRCVSRADIGSGHGRRKMGGVSAELVLVRAGARSTRAACRTGLAARGDRGAADGRGDRVVRLAAGAGLVGRAVRFGTCCKGPGVRHSGTADRPDVRGAVPAIDHAGGGPHRQSIYRAYTGGVLAAMEPSVPRLLR